MSRWLFIAIYALALCSTGCRAQAVDSTLYTEQPFLLRTPTGTISGTLCLPAHGTRVPVALIVAGSGPTDRDGNNILGVYCDCYKILAHRLAAADIATLRFDKRGVGGSRAAMSTESELRFTTYIDDARAWVDTLKRSGRFTQVVVIGHSEGSLVGMVAAQEADKYVSIAGLGNRIDVVLKHQMAPMPEPRRDTAYRIIDSLVAGDSVRYVPGKLRSLFRASVQPYMKSWLQYNPQTEIAKLRIPVLLLQGTNDMQVDTNEARLLAVADPKATLIFIPNMNHIFRIVPSEDRAENSKTYTDPSLPVSDDLVSSIVRFMKSE